MPNVSESYSYTEPTVGASDGTWGTSLNANWSQLDTDITAIAVALNGCLDLSGGTMTGELKVLTEVYTLQDEGTALTGTVELDCRLANFFALSTSGGGSITIEMLDAGLPSSGDVFFATIEITAAAGHTVTWPAEVEWPGGLAPTQTAPGTDVYVMYTRDGGTTWKANRVLEDVQ